MATLPVKPAKGSRKPEVTKSLVAIIKGSLPNCRVEDFPADPENACKRQSSFLSLWYNTSNMRKPEERKAFEEACPHLKTSEVKQIVNVVHECKTFLGRKKRNQKTGEKTEPVFKGLFQAIFGNKGLEMAQDLEKKTSAESMAETKPAKRLRSKTTPEKIPISQKPEEAEKQDAPASSSSGIFFAWNPEPAKACSERGTSEAGESILTISSGSISSSSGPVIAASSLKAAEGGKSASPKTSQKKPAQKNAAKKKPAAQPAEATNSWVASPSFGWVHETKASTKAYLVCKKAWEDKASCLVNVNLPKGERQSQVMAALVEKCKEEGWDKSKLVDYKNGLLAESLEKAE